MGDMPPHSAASTLLDKANRGLSRQEAYAKGQKKTTEKALASWVEQLDAWEFLPRAACLKRWLRYLPKSGQNRKPAYLGKHCVS